MSTDIRVADIQRAISDIRAWSNGSGYLPESKSDLLKAIADLLESLLVHRDILSKPELAAEELVRRQKAYPGDVTLLREAALLLNAAGNVRGLNNPYLLAAEKIETRLRELGEE